MTKSSIAPGRVSARDGIVSQKGAVVYWMQQSQRPVMNHALDFACELARTYQLPLVVLFVLMADVPDANSRHYRFMCQGLFDCARYLGTRKIRMLIGTGTPSDVLMLLQGQLSILVMDKGYLNWQRALRNDVRAVLSSVPVYEIEADVHVPVELVSYKEEYSAATLRPKLLKLLPYDLVNSGFEDHFSGVSSEGVIIPEGLTDISKISDETGLWKLIKSNVNPDDGVSEVSSFTGGYIQAKKKLAEFLDHRIEGYAVFRNHPGLDRSSDLSPYLHFGQISAQEVTLSALAWFNLTPDSLPALIKNKNSLSGQSLDLASFLEELIIRRELSCNFCHYNQAYDDFECLPLWARQTLYDHIDDHRPVQYSLDRLENAQTDDQYWNLAQRELLMSGKMHNYMRMYWGKKLIEWIKDPEMAYRYILWLNNRYELDGRDPNAFAGVAWCFGKHDRPWQIRSIFGSVRYMNRAGLDRKFDMKLYYNKIEELIDDPQI